MAPLRSLAAALVLAVSAQAHFTLDYPKTLGFEDSKEDSGPCGGFDVAADSTVTDFHVGGDNVATNLLHPQGTWLYRATLDTSGQANWTGLHPQVLQSGLGKFCQPAISVNASWAGKKGLIGTVVNAPDGLLYQCALVNFVEGKADKNVDACTNSSSVQASFTSDPGLASIPGASGGSSGGGSSSGGGGSSGGGSGTTPSGTGSGATPTPTRNVAPGLVGDSTPLGNLAMVLGVGLMGAAFAL